MKGGAQAGVAHGHWGGKNGRLGNGGLRGGGGGSGGGVRASGDFFWTIPEAPAEHPSCGRRVRAARDTAQLLHATAATCNAAQLLRATCNDTAR
jgi:hypothetical protein